MVADHTSFRIDHDFHLHSRLSTCSRDPEQTTQRLLRYAEENGFEKIVLTDHFWDSAVPGASQWYCPQDFAWISQVLPLPQSDRVSFLFGAETDMDAALTLGVSDERWDAFSFVVIPTTHLHFRGFTITHEDAETAQGRANAWIRRLDSLLSRDLPFHKIGIAHLACSLIAPDTETYRQVFELLPEQKLEELFAECARVGVGIELNSADMVRITNFGELVLRIFRIAKDKGCKFYYGSDSHQTHKLVGVDCHTTAVIEQLRLTEGDKFHIR